MAVWGLGKITATVVTPVLVRFLEQRRIGESHMFIGLLILTFAFFLGVFLADALWLILGFAFFAGLFDASTEAVYYAILQHSQVAGPTNSSAYLTWSSEREWAPASSLSDTPSRRHRRGR